MVKWQGYIPQNDFNNFEFYLSLLSKNNLLLPSLLRSFLIVIIVNIVLILLVIFIVHNLYRKVFGWRFYQGIIFITSIIPLVVSSIVWTFLLNLNGPVNTLLRILNLNFLIVDWFGNGRTVLLALCWIIIWRELGFATIMFLAQLSGADKNVYEAAMIDGASELQLIRYVTVPYLIKIIKLYSILTTIFILNNLFGVIQVTTSGGPGFSSTVLEYYIYYLTFRAGKIGMGATVAVILFLITLILIVIYIRYSSKKRSEAII